MYQDPSLNLTKISCVLAMTFALVSQVTYAEEQAAQAVEVLPEYTFMDAIKDGKNLTSFRLRYENVSQDGNAPVLTPARPLEDANGITLRSLIGWQTAPYHNFSFGAQLIDVSKLEDKFNDSTSFTPISAASNQPDKLAYAKIVDPDYTGVNQLYMDWTGIKNTKFRLGRQQTNLDNVRFIGDIGFRQVMQVFDGVSVLTKSVPDTDIYLAHFESVRQITTKLRTNGKLEIANAKYYMTPTESVTGYAYLSSFDDLGLGNGWFGAGAANAARNQSNKTFGVRVDGIHPFTPNYRAVYTAEYAKQSDYAGGDKAIDAHYYKVGGGVGIDFLTVRLDQELLSSNNNNFAFQTPFGTNHLFQGWVDKFLATPKSGIRDTFATATYRFNDLMLFADYHVLQSDVDFFTVGSGTARNGSKYGTEWNVAATYNFDKNIMAKIEYGKYSEADNFAAAANTANTTAGNAGRIRDTDKLWLTAMYTF
jgi:hypothetical protein